MKIIMIHSFKGGSGKTLISSNLANILANTHNKRVLLVEADLDGPVLNNMFTDVRPDVFTNQYLSQRNKPISQYIYRVKYNFDVVFASPKFRIEDIVKSDEYDGLLDKMIDIKKELSELNYDYVIWDLSPGVNYIAIATVLLASDIIIVLRPDNNSFKGTQLLLDRIYVNILDLKKKNLYLIINQIPGYQKFDELIEKWKHVFKETYPFINDIYSIPFSELTNYYFAINNEILPEDDKSRMKLHKIVQLMKFSE